MIAALLAIALQSSAAAPQAQDPTAVVRGRVITPDGRPMIGAHMRLTRSDSPQRPRSQSTDEDGTFEFTQLAAGQYTLLADKSGFASSEAVPIALGAAETKEHVDLTLKRLSAIAGRVVDENGDPVEGAVMNVLRLRA
ncbi:MAG TPA: carboxypeptidase-like regulatory domain-containing protein, partial [Vicinamibacterales bacterium]|nr:carboxypeptidase-like regulatory domain-containing protein [Vicinamibacterales bacterium]